MIPLRDLIESGLRAAVAELLPDRSVVSAAPEVAETRLAEYPEGAVVAPDMQASVIAPIKVDRGSRPGLPGPASAILSFEPESALTWLRWRGLAEPRDPEAVLARFREEGVRLLLAMLGGAILPERARVREEELVATVLGTHAPGGTRVATASFHVADEHDVVAGILTILSDPKAPPAAR